MKPLMFAAALATAALAGVPASGQSSEPDRILPLDGNFVGGSNPAFRARGPADMNRCFDGYDIAGVSREGDTLYVQSRYVRTREPARIFRMELKESCDALDEAKAQSLVARSGNARVCEGSPGWIEFATPAGDRSCKVGKIRVLDRDEAVALAQSKPR